MVFTFFDHPYDVGDRVEIYTAATQSVAAVVKRQSLLYTVFCRADNGTDMQIANDRPAAATHRKRQPVRGPTASRCRCTWLSRRTSRTSCSCGASSRPSWPRTGATTDPTWALSVVGVHELNKLELRVGFTHKSNWGNERLRAARSNKFYCALIAAVRLLALEKPGGRLATGDEAKPMYTVQLTPDEARTQTQAAAARRRPLRPASTPRPPTSPRMWSRTRPPSRPRRPRPPLSLP